MRRNKHLQKIECQLIELAERFAHTRMVLEDIKFIFNMDMKHNFVIIAANRQEEVELEIDNYEQSWLKNTLDDKLVKRLRKSRSLMETVKKLTSEYQEISKNVEENRALCLKFVNNNFDPSAFKDTKANFVSDIDVSSLASKHSKFVIRYKKYKLKLRKIFDLSAENQISDDKIDLPFESLEDVINKNNL